MSAFRAAAALLTAVLGLLAAAPWGVAQQDSARDGDPIVYLVAVEGPIGPATVRHVDRAIALAEEREAAALVLRLNTPGGLAGAMREVTSAILASQVPVIGHVAPSGAHAASAGTFILYATHLAAMAPGTNLGAATPVQIGGGPPGLPGSDEASDGTSGEAGNGAGNGGDGAETDGPSGAGAETGAGEETAAPDPGRPDDALGAKATNDAVALIRSLAEMHGRNADWAERAVREAASLSASAALQENVIDLVARDTDDLLTAADGRTVRVSGTDRTLATAGATVETIQMTAVTRILSVLSNPNVALVLMMIGVYGLIFEFLNPGAIGPGVVGAICLTLGLYALNQLPLDIAGLALIALGIAFMVAEALSPSFGVLGLGGLVAFVFGASMLIDTDVPAYQVSWWMIGTVAAVSGAVLILLMGVTVRAYRGPSVSGAAGMIGQQARIIEWSGDEGYVWLDGERWHATGLAGLGPGDRARVRAVDGLTLRLDPPRPDRKGEK